jgi:hypothetical protein
MGEGRDGIGSCPRIPRRRCGRVSDLATFLTGRSALPPLCFPGGLRYRPGMDVYRIIPEANVCAPRCICGAAAGGGWSGPRAPILARHPIALQTEPFWPQKADHLHANPCRKELA